MQKQYIFKILLLAISSLIFEANASKDAKAAKEKQQPSAFLDYLLHPEKTQVTLIESDFDRPGGYRNFEREGLTRFKGSLPNGNTVTIAFFGFSRPQIGQVFDQDGNPIENLSQGRAMQYFISLVEQAKAKMHRQGRAGLVQAYPGSSDPRLAGYYVEAYSDAPRQQPKAKEDKSKSATAASAAATAATPGTGPDVSDLFSKLSLEEKAKNKGKTAESAAASAQPAIPGTGPDQE